MIYREIVMITVSIDEERLKDLLKSALSEVLEVCRDLVQDIVEEALEDSSQRAGARRKSISREENVHTMRLNSAPLNPIVGSRVLQSHFKRPAMP